MTPIDWFLMVLEHVARGPMRALTARRRRIDKATDEDVKFFRSLKDD